MFTPEASLSRCVGDVDAFLADVWGRRWLLHRGEDTTAFADLLTVADVDELVATGGLRTPSVRLVRDGEAIPSARYTRRATIGSTPVTDLADPGKVFALFDEGATIVLQGLQRLSGSLACFCRDLELVLTHPVQANAYLTPPGAAGLARHVDAHDVFALQTHGRKRWVVADGDEERDLELTAGDGLYLPAGTSHAARSVEDASLHVTIGVRALTWDDVEQEALDLVAGSASAVADAQAATPPAAAASPGDEKPADRRLPAGFATDPAFPETVARRLRELSERLASLDADVVAERVSNRFWKQRRPPLAGQLSQLLTLDGTDDRTLLRRRPGAVATVTVDEADVTLALGDRQVVLPARVAPAVRRILERQELAVGELADLLDEHGRGVLARRLVREGLLVVVDR